MDSSRHSKLKVLLANSLLFTNQRVMQSFLRPALFEFLGELWGTFFLVHALSSNLLKTELLRGFSFTLHAQTILFMPF